jgi:hypothetical protein
VLCIARALKKSHMVQTTKFQASKVHNLVVDLMQKVSSQLGLIPSSIG